MNRTQRLVVVGVIAVAIVVVGALVAVSATQESSSPARADTVAGATTSLFDGIPQSRIVLGKPSAPVTLVEFADPQCPYCAEFASGALPAVVRDYVRDGRVKIVFQGMSFLGRDSEVALRAIYAAALQNRGWNMLDGLYSVQGAENSGWVTDSVLRDLAAGIPGLDVSRMLREMSSPTVTGMLHDGHRTAEQAGVSGTPTFFVGRSGGQLSHVRLTSLTAEALAPALDGALRG